MQQQTAPDGAAALTVLAPQGATMEEWMRTEDLNDQQVADMMGKDKTTVWRVRTGKAQPSNGFIEKVIEISNGAVDANSFFKRALTKAAASRGGDGSEPPFSSRSTCLDRPPGGRSRSPQPHRPATSSPSSQAPAPSRRSSAKRSSI